MCVRNQDDDEADAEEQLLEPESPSSPKNWPQQSGRFATGIDPSASDVSSLPDDVVDAIENSDPSASSGGARAPAAVLSARMHVCVRVHACVCCKQCQCHQELGPQRILVRCMCLLPCCSPARVCVCVCLRVCDGDGDGHGGVERDCVRECACILLHAHAHVQQHACV